LIRLNRLDLCWTADAMALVIVFHIISEAVNKLVCLVSINRLAISRVCIKR
jgi:hypothetical protein